MLESRQIMDLTGDGPVGFSYECTKTPAADFSAAADVILSTDRQFYGSARAFALKLKVTSNESDSRHSYTPGTATTLL
jgi:hypothetical protein